MKSAVETAGKIAPHAFCIALAGAFACDGAGTGNGTGGDEEYGTVQGEVAEENGQNFAPTDAAGSAEASVVTAHRVEADGSTEEVSVEPATVEADGSYSVEVEMDAVAGSEILVRAEGEAEGETAGQVAISETFDADATMQAPPIDGEATVVAELFLEARAEGAVSADVGPGMFWLAAGTELAGELDGAGEAEIEAAAEAAAAAAAGWKAALEHESAGASEQDVETALEFSAEAETVLASELGGDDTSAALEAYAEAVIDAHADAGIGAEYVARAGATAGEVMKAYASELEGEASASLTVAAEAHKARAVTKAVLEFAETELEGAADGLADAGASARAEIEAAAEAGGDAEAEIAGAWLDLRAEAEAEIAAALDVAESEIESMVGELEAEAESLASALGELGGSIAIGANLDVAIEGFVDFYAEAYAAADADLDVELPEGDLEAAVEVLATLVACNP